MIHGRVGLNSCFSFFPRSSRTRWERTSECPHRVGSTVLGPFLALLPIVGIRILHCPRRRHHTWFEGTFKDLILFLYRGKEFSVGLKGLYNQNFSFSRGVYVLYQKFPEAAVRHSCFTQALQYILLNADADSSCYSRPLFILEVQ